MWIILNSSPTAWLSAVTDLLIVSPNSRLRSSLSGMTAEGLKRLATDYYNSFHRLSANFEIPTFTREMSQSVRDIRLIPGAPFAIWVSIYATVHLIDVRTSQEVSLWKPSISVMYANQADIEIWDSDSRLHACVFLVSVGIITEQ
jgi:hypothetical protein